MSLFEFFFKSRKKNLFNEYEYYVCKMLEQIVICVFFSISVQQENVKDDPVLREKVEQLQRMMEDRKRRRQSRRQTLAPYIIESRNPENEETMCETADILTPKESETLAV